MKASRNTQGLLRAKLRTVILSLFFFIFLTKVSYMAELRVMGWGNILFPFWEKNYKLHGKGHRFRNGEKIRDPSTIFSKPYKIKGQELRSFCVQRTCLRSDVIFPWGRTRSFDTKCFSLLLYYRHSCLELDGGDSRRLALERLNMQMVSGLTTYKNRTLTHNLVSNQPGKPDHTLCSKLDAKPSGPGQ